MVTPVPNPDVHKDDDYAWCFPDTEAGILAAIGAGATHLWSNTILFASHPLQTSAAIGRFADAVQVVGQPPLQVEQFDDKVVVNDMLRSTGQFTMPLGWTLCDPGSTGTGTTTATATTTTANGAGLREYIAALSLPYPVVGKPIRGRGSHGVRVCASLDEMVDHAAALFRESPRFMVEEYLAGEEGTVTVMPPSGGASANNTVGGGGSGDSGNGGYRALPVVRRTDHRDGIAPYNGTVAVSANSRAVTGAESAADGAYALAQAECERAAALLGCTGVMRIDVRRRGAGGGDGGPGEVNKFCLFDVNVKPVSSSLSLLSPVILPFRPPSVPSSTVSPTEKSRHKMGLRCSGEAVGAQN